VFVDH